MNYTSSSESTNSGGRSERMEGWKGNESVVFLRWLWRQHGAEKLFFKQQLLL